MGLYRQFEKDVESGKGRKWAVWGTIAFIIAIAFILAMVGNLFAGSGKVALTWTPPTTNEDGTPLTDLGGYILFVGGSAGAYTDSIDVGDVTAYMWDQGPQDGGVLYFNIKAYDTSGNRSAFNGEVDVPFTMVAPSHPTNLQGVEVP